MIRNGKITATLLVAALAAVGCSKDKPSTTNTTNPEATSSAKMTPVSMPITPKPVADKPVDATPKVSGHVSFADGEAAYQAGKFAEARQIFEQYTAEKPKNAWGYYMLGLTENKAGDPTKAETAYEEALSIDPDHLKSLFNLSRLLIDQKRFDEAIVRIGHAGDVDPSSAEVQRLLGRAYNGLNKSDEAIDSYRKAIALAPSDVWSMNNVGLILMQQGKSADATPFFAQAVELKKKNPTFHNNLGMALEQTGRYKAALAEYKAAFAADPGNEKAKQNLARVAAIKTGSEEPFDRAAEAKRAVEVKQPTTEPASVAK